MPEKHLGRKSRLATCHQLLVLTAALGAAFLAKPTTASAALVLTPIGVSGFNADTIVDAAASTTTGSHTAFATVSGMGGGIYTSSTNVETSDLSAAGTGAYLGTGYVHNGEEFFQNGWNSLTTGLPASGSFTSAYTNNVGSNTLFSYGFNGTNSDYADNNTLYFATAATQTLTLTTPMQASDLAFLAAAELPKPYTTRSEFDVKLNFQDGTSDTYTQAIVTGPLGDNGASLTGVTNKAITGLYGAENGNGSKSTVFGGGGFMTESDLSLSTADQAETIVSMTFTEDPINTDGGVYNPAAIYAVSGGLAVVPEPVSFATLASIGGLTLLSRRHRQGK